MESSIIQKLASLGCFFSNDESRIEADPEQTIIDALEYFWSDKKVFTMLIGLLKFRLYHLVNTKRLGTLALNISGEKQVLLAVISSKVARHTGDIRYGQLAARLRKKKPLFKKWPKEYSDSFYLNRKGVDKDFKKFKVTVPDFFDQQSEKKFKPLKRIYSENLWLKVRAIAGPDYRADAIYLRSRGAIKTQSELAKTLGCNKSSISRFWNSIQDIDLIHLGISTGGNP